MALDKVENLSPTRAQREDWHVQRKWCHNEQLCFTMTLGWSQRRRWKLQRHRQHGFLLGLFCKHELLRTDWSVRWFLTGIQQTHDLFPFVVWMWDLNYLLGIKSESSNDQNLCWEYRIVSVIVVWFVLYCLQQVFKWTGDNMFFIKGDMDSLAFGGGRWALFFMMDAAQQK